jgi:hypothetical protein
MVLAGDGHLLDEESMARGPGLASVSTAQLERILEQRRREASKLKRERNKLQQKLSALDRRLMMIDGTSMRGGGGAGGAGGGRARNEHSLVESMEMVLTKTGKPMRVGEIVQGVLGSGYRTSSANFRGIVNQTLIKERKRFASAGRGSYQLKK